MKNTDTAFINKIHKALDTYNIAVNSQINKEQNLECWIKDIAIAQFDQTKTLNELKDITKGLKDSFEVKSAWHTILSKNKAGRLLLKIYKPISYSILSALGTFIAYEIFIHFDPHFGSFLKLIGGNK